MCGRFALEASPEAIASHFLIAGLEEFPPRYNIAPTQPILAVTAGPRRAPGSNQPERSALLVRWGLIPGWMKDLSGLPLLINARAETAGTKAAFRAAMRHRRALVPASGFYEWRREGNRTSRPYWVRPRDGGIVAFGAILETFAEPGGSEIDTGAILTTEASADLAAIHGRMPVVIRPEDFSRWLDCAGNEPRDVAGLMRSPPAGLFEAVPVSERVNKVANMGPDLQLRVEPPAVAPGAGQEPRAGGAGGQLELF
jgi:putative SOS response-associated peptidase YedK